MNFLKRNAAESAGFQLAPMIDIMFLLLSFFVTSQIFAQWETEVPIELPTSQTGDPPDRLPGEIIINLTAEGTIVVNQTRRSVGELETMLKRLAENFPGQPVLIRADQVTEYQHVIKVLDLCRMADIWNISFATQVPD